MKKLVATILIALLAMSCLFAFVGCNNNDSEDYGEPFVGAISQSTYDSVEEAVKGFLKEEISGMSFTAEYVGYTKTVDLTQQEINELAIDEELKSDIVSVERGEVEYIENYSNNELLTKLAVETYKRKVYIFEYKQNGEIKYRFYTPIEEVGQTPSASAWDSIMQYDKYHNCTIDYSLDYGEGKLCTNYYIFTEEAMYIFDLVDSDGYVISYNNFLVSVFKEVSTDGDIVWSVGDLVDANNEAISMNDIIEARLLYILWWHCALYIGHENFIKTETGYESRTEFRREEDLYEYSILGDYHIVITNGRISEISFKIIESHYTYPNDTIIASGIQVRVKFSDFDIAKVEVPEDAMDAIKSYFAEN